MGIEGEWGPQPTVKYGEGLGSQSHGLLADSVDTTFAIVYSCTTVALFSEVHDQ